MWQTYTIQPKITRAADEIWDDAYLISLARAGAATKSAETGTSGCEVTYVSCAQEAKDHDDVVRQ